MSVLDKFLNAMKLNDDDGFDDEDYLDEEVDDYEEPRAKRRLLKNRDDDDLFDDYADTTAAASETKYNSSAAKAKQPQIQVKTKSTSKVSPIRTRKANSPGMEVCVIKPHTMEDAREITETLLANCTVVLNMEGLDLEVAQRIIDFASGSCYAMDGNLQKISNYIFIITPASVDISGDFQEILTGAFDVPSFEKKF